MTHLVYQLEQSPESGAIHWQGYVGFKKTQRWRKVMEYLGMGECFVEPSKSGAAIDYCKKKESSIDEHIEKGKPSSPGSRSDLEDLRTLIVSGSSIGTLWRTPTQFTNLIRYGRGVREAIQYLQPKTRSQELEVIYIWGEPGTGKSHQAWQEEPGLFPMCQEKWLDGYDGEEVILIDEFDKIDFKKVSMEYYLRLMDKYPFMAGVKHGSVWFKGRKFYLTANVPVDALNITQEEQRSLYRRITQTIHKQGQPWLESQSAFGLPA